MLTMNSYSKRYRAPSNANAFPIVGTGNLLSRPRLPPRSYAKPKSSYNLASIETTPFCRSKRFKSRKINGCQKIDGIKKKTIPDYTENAYREAVSKLKYLLAESYAPRMQSGKLSRDRGIYRRSNNRMNETPEDSDDRSVSDCSRSKGLLGAQFDGSHADDMEKNRRAIVLSQNSIFPTRDTRSPSELMSFIARQEEYIEQLERESHYCKDELKNLLEKISQVVAENDALHDKNKTGLFKNFLRELERCDGNKNIEKSNFPLTDRSTNSGTKEKIHRTLEGPNIIFESRISELEAQLTQARIELKKAREDNDANARRLAENCGTHSNSDCAVQLDQVLREKRELGDKLEEALKNLQSSRDRENEVTQKIRRTKELTQQMEFEKYQAESEIRRLNDELDRQREKLRGAAQDASRRVVEERHQIERRYSQQVEQLSADVASHWDAASKSHMETEKQRRELAELKRDLAQKQTTIEDLKKELQNKISNLQSDLNQSLAEKDVAEQEAAAAKLAIERNERHARQEQSRWQVEINSYKQRLERADADVLHCRRENLRLSEQIASLEKELNVTKLVRSQEAPNSATTPKPDGEKDLTTMIMDMETKQEAAVGDDGDGIKLTTTPSKKKRTVKVDLKIKVTPKKKSSVAKTIKLPLSAQEEMANLQSNIEYISSKINDALGKKEVEQAVISDTNNAKHSDEIVVSKTENPALKEYPISEPEKLSYPRDYVENPVGQFQNKTDDHAIPQKNVDYANPQENVVYENPQENVDYAIPQENVNYENPQENVNYKNPQENVNYENPQENVNYENPQENVNYENPQENVNYENPQENVNYENPQENVNYENPQENVNYENPQENVDYAIPQENVVTEEPQQHPGPDNVQNYGLQEEQKYESQAYENYPAEYSNQDYAQYEQYDPSMYEQNPSGEVGQQLEGAAYEQDQRQYEEYPAVNYPDDQSQQLTTEEQNFDESTNVESTRSDA